MTTDNREYLSRLADDELHGSELHTTLDALFKNAELRQSWANYHAIREALHGQSNTELGSRLHQRVTAALEMEPAILAPRNLLPQGWLRHVAGFAVAASVTGVAILGIQQLNQGSGSGTTTPVMVAQPQVENYARIEIPAVSAERVDKDHLAAYLVNHNEYSSSTNMQGMLPYVRIVGHGSQR